jgi:hypothetical protein
MADLNGRDCILFANKIRQPAVLGNMTIVPNTGAGVGFPADILDRRFLAEYDTGATDCHPTNMHHLPIRRPAIDRVVLAHGRGNDPVARCQTTHT